MEKACLRSNVLFLLEPPRWARATISPKLSHTMHSKLPFGLRDNKPIHISEIKPGERGKACKCLCPHCKGQLIAKLGDIRIHHFAHTLEDCGHGLETGLHLFAKKIIVEHKRLFLPPVIASVGFQRETIFEAKMVEFDEVIPEEYFHNFKPDLRLRKGSLNLIVEIAVTHKVDDEKLSKIRLANVSALEISLDPSDFQGTEVNLPALTQRIIEQTQDKEWLFNVHASTRELKMRQEASKGEEMLQAKHREDQQKESLRLTKLIELLDPQYQRAQREKWADELKNSSLWLNAANKLGISSETCPDFLNIEIAGDFVFGCDRRVW